MYVTKMMAASKLCVWLVVLGTLIHVAAPAPVPAPTSSLRELEQTPYFPIVCKIIQIDVQFGQVSAEGEGGASGASTNSDEEESYVCLADTLDGGFDQAYRIINLPPTILDQLDAMDSSSSLAVAISMVYLDAANATLLVADDAEIAAKQELNQQGERRRLAKSQGVNKVLVIRVTHKNSAPSLTKQQLAGRIFGLGEAAARVSLSSQFRACSFSKLRMIPGKGDGIENGVMEISIDEPVSGDFSVLALENLVVNKASRAFGALSSSFDHVLIVLPRGYKYDGRSYLAYGYVGGLRAVFEDEWAGRISSLVHEVGHTLNLAHAGKGTERYGDLTGMMGYGSFSTFTESCFNAQKNWALGWYEDRAVSLTNSNFPWGGQLTAFVDYGVSTPGQAVVIKIGASSPRLFLQYNRAKGANAQTRDLANQVVIVRDEGMTKKVAGLQSWLVAGIMVGHATAKPVYRYPKYDGNSALVIEVCKKFGGDPDYVELSIYLDNGIQKSTCGNGNSNQQQPCRDSSGKFYVSQKDTYKSCTWLSNKFSRWGDRLCKSKFEAFHTCPKTCGSCGGGTGCSDASVSEKFVVNDNLGEKSCKWLSTRGRWQKRLCYDGHEAFQKCPETCGRCS